MRGIFIIDANVNDSDYTLPLTDGADYRRCHGFGTELYGTALLNTQLIFFHPVINLDEICNKLWARHELTKPWPAVFCGSF